MNSKELLKFYKEQIKSNPALDSAFWADCDFCFDDNINVDNDILICGEESNYEIYPFGKDAMGGVFCLLNNEYIGYISSEGGCGIISKNINDFFNLLATCKSLTSYFHKGVFDTFDSFKEKYEKINNENVEINNLYLYDNFINKNGFITDVSIVYNMFKAGLVIEPSFTLKADPTQYSPWDDVFYTEQEYIEKLRTQK